MFEERLSFLEFALGKLTEAVEEMLVGMEERKKGEIDVDGVKQGKNIYCIKAFNSKEHTIEIRGNKKSSVKGRKVEGSNLTTLRL